MTNHEGMTKPENSGESEESFWLGNEAPHVREEPDAKPAYDLEERTARFGEAIIDFAKKSRQGRSLSGSLVNWSEQEQAWAPITTKPTMQSQKRNF